MRTSAHTRRAVLLAFGAALGKLDVLKAATRESTGLLTVDLSQWGGIQFKHKGRAVVIPVAEVFDALVNG